MQSSKLSPANLMRHAQAQRGKRSRCRESCGARRCASTALMMHSYVAQGWQRATYAPSQLHGTAATAVLEAHCTASLYHLVRGAIAACSTLQSVRGAALATPQAAHTGLLHAVGSSSKVNPPEDCSRLPAAAPHHKQPCACASSRLERGAAAVDQALVSRARSTQSHRCRRRR